MKRIYYAFLPLTYQRPGGVWWYRDVAAHEVDQCLVYLKPVSREIRLSDEFPQHDPMSIAPPASATVVKTSGEVAA